MINYLDYRYSKAKGQTAAGTVFNSSINMLASDANYSSNYVENETHTTAADQTVVQLSWYPIVGTPVVTVDGTATTAFTFDAATGKITFTAAPGANKSVVVTYYFDNESVTTDGPTAAGFTNVQRCIVIQ